ncbi:MAG TPA: hypothetical protein VIT44_19110 [Cyclobacteriaceae bacterium]
MKKITSYLQLLLTGLLITGASALQAQSLNTNWRSNLKTSLNQFLSCTSIPSSKECVKFLGESLQTVYKVNDFYAKSKYMNATEVAAFLKKSKQWSVIGHAYEQNTLQQAQDNANKKKAVVAAYINEAGVGHVVVITPGQVQSSGSWGLNVPNAVSFFLPQPSKSFVDKSLAFAFTKAQLKDVVIYVRKY